MDHLHTEYVFTFVPFQQGPLRLLPLQQVCAHGHLATRNVCAEALAHATEGKISTLER